MEAHNITTQSGRLLDYLQIRPSEGRIGAYYRIKNELNVADQVIAEAWFESPATFNRWKKKCGIKSGRGNNQYTRISI